MLKIRSSATGNIVTGISLKPIPLTEKQSIRLTELRSKESNSQERRLLEKKLIEIPENKLSAGAKTYIRDVFYGEKYEFQKTFTSKFTEKGKKKESASIKALSKFLGIYVSKNEVRLFNDWQKGTPDVRVNMPKMTIDTKNIYYPNGLHKFKDEQEETNYIWQIHSYNFLDEKDDGFVARILMNPPAEIIQKEVWNYWKSDGNEGVPTDDFIKEVTDYFDFEKKRPIEDRVTLTHVKTSQNEIDIIKKSVELAREYWIELEEQFNSKNKIAIDIINELNEK